MGAYSGAAGAERSFCNRKNPLTLTKPWLLNFGRGQIVNDNDLIAAVGEKTIAGAVLDVFRQEPLPQDDPFRTTEGIVVLPHIGGPHP